MDELSSGHRCLDLFAFHVVDDLLFECRDDDVNVDGLGLPEPPAPSDRLVVRLV